MAFRNAVYLFQGSFTDENENRFEQTKVTDMKLLATPAFLLNKNMLQLCLYINYLLWFSSVEIQLWANECSSGGCMHSKQRKVVFLRSLSCRLQSNVIFCSF